MRRRLKHREEATQAPQAGGLEAIALDALRPVMDPELRRSIVDLGMVRSLAVADGRAAVTISLTTPGCPIRSQFERAVTEALVAVDGIDSVDVSFDVLSGNERQGLTQKLGRATLPEGALARVGTVLCVASGKGGVGKSTLSVNLAAALLAEGRTVGLLDADIWGHSVPRMLGIRQKPQVSAERKLVPPVALDALKVMSIGFFVQEDSAIVWRGPMLHKALSQLLADVDWGELDVLVVDLPPGTGDVSLSLAEFLPQARFVIVTTPQPAAQQVARRAARMAQQLEHEVAGVVENMSGYVDADGRHHPIFGAGGGAELAEELDVPLLGHVPLTIPLREHADRGRPLVLEAPDDPASRALSDVARAILALRPQQPVPLPMAAAPAPTPPAGSYELPMVQHGS